MGDNRFDVREGCWLQQRSNGTKVLSESSEQATEINGPVGQIQGSSSLRLGTLDCWRRKGKRSQNEERNEAEETHIGGLACLRGCFAIDGLDCA